MTGSPDEMSRDWDAEFAEITGRLGLSDQEAHAPTRGANRDTFTHDPRPEPAPSTATAPLTETVVHPDTPPPDASSTARRDISDAMTVGHDTRDGDVSGSDALTDHVDEDDFVPPQPAPLETDDPATTIMIGCLVAGPLWLLYLTIFDRDTAPLWWLLAALTLTAGFVLAIMRQPRRRDDEDDDGARV